MNPNRIIKIFTALGTLAESLPKVSNAQIASAIVIKNEIRVIGIPRMKTHPLQNQYKKCSNAIYLHSEIDSIRKALRILSQEELLKATLFIARVKKFGFHAPYTLGWGLAKPCCGCLQAIESFDLHKVYYTMDGLSLAWEELIRN